jgi:hypothetical protein
MAIEIDVRIRVNEQTLEIEKTELGVSVNNPLTYDAMDFILLDAFSTLADKMQDKINHHNHNENLN